MKYFYFFIVVVFLSGPFAWSGDQPLPGDSLFHLRSTWKNQAGKDFSLASLRGKKTLLAMVYLSCGFSCPTIVSTMQGLGAQLDEATRAQIKFVLVSFDHERDSPAKLAEFAAKRELDAKQWLLLSTSKKGIVQELAAALNFKFQKTGTDYTHSFLIVALDENGSVISRLDSVSQNRQPMLDALQKK